MRQGASFRIRPEKKRVTRMAVLANSYESEPLCDFIDRMKANTSTINGAQVTPKGGYRKQFIPRYNEERWVTTLEEKHYAQPLD